MDHRDDRTNQSSLPHQYYRLIDELDSYKAYITGSSLQGKTSRVTATFSGRYFNSAVFPGSATAREVAGELFANVYKKTKTLEQAFADAYVKATGATQEEK